MDKKLDIVQIVARIPAPPIDGGSRYVFNTGKMLADLGHKLTVIAFNSKKHIQRPDLINSFADIFFEDDEFKDFNLSSVLKSFIKRIPISVIHRMDIHKMERLLDIFIKNRSINTQTNPDLKEFIKAIDPTQTLHKGEGIKNTFIEKTVNSDGNEFIRAIDPTQTLHKGEGIKNNFIEKTFNSDGKEFIREIDPTQTLPKGEGIKKSVILSLLDFKNRRELIVSKNKYLFLLEGIHSGLMIDTLRKKFPESKIIFRQANVEHELLLRRAKEAKNPLLKLFFLIQSKLMYEFELSCFKKCDGVTAISEYDRDKFKKMLPELKCHVVFPSSELSKPDFSKRNAKIMLAISDWSWHPNIIGLTWFLNEIFPNIKNIFSDIEFNIVGGGITEDFKNQYKDENVHFLGFVESLTEYYESAYILVVPLLYGGGVKIKLIDALSKGMTIITTQFGVEGIPVTSGKEVMIEDDKLSFIKCIETLINDPTKSRQLSENAFKWAESNLNSNEIALKMEKFLESII